ncbi:MAG: hypothetical protein ACLP8A_05085 [Methylovirgula sp.]
MRIRRLFFLSARIAATVLAGDLAVPALAGAFLAPPGEGVIITATSFSDSTRAFDSNGKLIPIPAYRKFELSSYIEYGLTDRVTLVVQPSGDVAHQGPVQTVAPFAASTSLGARAGLLMFGSTVVSVQGVAHIPFGTTSMQAGLFDQDRAFAADFRLMLGHGFAIKDMNGFVDVAVGPSFEGNGLPQQWHADVTLGLRPQPRLLLMLASYMTAAGRIGSGCANWTACWSWLKLQPTIVYDLTRHWSIEGGFFATVAGQNAGRELGPLAGLWYRF